MATAPMSQPAAPAEDPTAEMPEAPEAEGGYTICIKVGADGQIYVGLENPAAEAAESPEQEAAEESGLQPVKSIKDALTAALEIYRSNGQAPEDSASMQDEFQSGYKGK